MEQDVPWFAATRRQRVTHKHRWRSLVAHSYRRSIDLNTAWRPYNMLEFVPRESTDVASDRPPTLSLSRGTWPILGRIDYYPNREIFTDASIDSFFFFSSRSSRSNDPRSRVVSKWLIGCPSSEVFHRFVSRENDEDSRGMEREGSRVRFARVRYHVFFELF